MRLYPPNFCMRCCKKTTVKIIYAPTPQGSHRPTDFEKIFSFFGQKKVLSAGSESGLSQDPKRPLAGPLSDQPCSGANLLAVDPYSMQQSLGCFHACNFCYSTPLSGHASADVCYLEYHAQAQLTHALGVSSDELYHFSFGSIV